MDSGVALPAIIDIILAILLLIFAWQALHSRNLFTSIIYFISFGLLMSLVWVRLNAPDVALAEAAIGAGLSGALLLQAYARLHSSSEQTLKRQAVQIQALTIILCLVIAAGLSYILFHSDTAAGLNHEVEQSLHLSGVTNPVTAVLLNFRGYDTLLELMVLLVAALGIRSLCELQIQKINASPVLITFSRLLIPMLILVAGYLLWAGADFPGGAFQAGSVLAAAGVLSLLSSWNPKQLINTSLFRILLIAGPGVFLIIALYTLLLNDVLLQMHNDLASRLIFILEAIATASIGLTLTVLFAANSTATAHTDRHTGGDHP